MSSNPSPRRKPRARSTIGVNPLDATPSSTLAAEDAPARKARTEHPGVSGAGQRVFDAWVSGTEGVLQAVFEAQNSALRANLSILEAGTSAQRRITRELTEAAREAQAAALKAFHARLQDMQR